MGMKHEYDLEELPEWQHMPKVFHSPDCNRRVGGDCVCPREPEKEGVAKWSGKEPPPKIGERVYFRMNGFGWGTVRSYFVEHGYLGVFAKLEKPPAWYLKQNNGNMSAHFFGIDIEKK